MCEITNDLGVQIAENLVLTMPPGYPPEASCYVNHSCDPNAGFQGQIVLVAMRPIHVNEEITFDYAMCLHAAPGSPRYELECHCGQPNCRKVVTEDDWQRPELQHRYEGYFQWFLQERIKTIQTMRDNTARSANGEFMPVAGRL